MLKPSYAELIDALNKDASENSEVNSRYTVVIAAAKRARQIIAGDKPMVSERKGKPLSTAVNELLNNKIQIVPEGQGTVLNFDKVETSDESINDKSNDDFLNKESLNFDLEQSTELEIENSLVHEIKEDDFNLDEDLENLN